MLSEENFPVSAVFLFFVSTFTSRFPVTAPSAAIFESLIILYRAICSNGSLSVTSFKFSF